MSSEHQSFTTRKSQEMSQTTPGFVTCPQGHNFPQEQLTVRDGQNVCPVCDRTTWAEPRARRSWSRHLLTLPLIVVIAAVVMLLVETISGIGIGTTYQSQHIGGAAWLTAGSAVSVVGIGLLIAGVVLATRAVRSRSWTRSLLAAPLLVMAGGAAVLAIGDLVDLGLNLSFLNSSSPGATWQLVAGIFDALFFGGLAVALSWVGLLAKRSDPITTDAPDVTGL
jgi:hypothetical protein